MNEIIENVNKIKEVLSNLNVEQVEKVVNNAIQLNTHLKNAYDQQDDYNRSVNEDIRSNLKESIEMIFEKNETLIRAIENFQPSLNSSFLVEIKFFEFKERHKSLYEIAKIELGI